MSVQRVAKPRKLRNFVVVLLNLAVALGYVAIPVGIRVQYGLPMPAFVEDLAWQAAASLNQPAGYAWFQRQWPSERNAERVAQRMEGVLWARASHTNDYEDFASYLATYPNGTHASMARAGIEERLWLRIQAIGLENSYRAYLEDWPSGPHAKEALQALNEKPWLRKR